MRPPSRAASQAAPLQAAVKNRLLALMVAEDFGRLAPSLAAVDLAEGDSIAEPDEVIEWVYFVESGIISTVAISPEDHRIEAGLTGREGFAPTAPYLAVDIAPNRVNVQVPGTAWRMLTTAFVEALGERASLRALLGRFLQTRILQTTYTALSHAVHPVEERLARWLLMCDDRVDGGEVALTHEFISLMLAVRRPSVTTALHVLEGAGFIRNERKCVIIRDRAALERFAGDAYGKPEAAYRDLIGSMRPPL